MLAVLIVGLVMNAVALPLAARRVWFLYRVISSGQPAPDRIDGVTRRLGAVVKRQVVEVLGQKKLLKWSVPGAAHFFVFWAFLILATVYLEAYGNLLTILFGGNDTQLDWAIPLVGTWPVLGFLQDFIAMMAFFGILTFVVIRLRNAPKELGRRSRFFGSHLSGAWITLFMIFNVIWTMFLFRGASSGLGNLPYRSGAFISIGVGKLLPAGALEALEGVGLLLHIGVMLIFLIFVLNSKHLHIFVAPLNVMFGRPGVALGAAKPLMSGGKPVTMDDIDDLDEDAKLGVGAAEDFSWKGILDFTTCTECGRCQDQCPAWNTEKPLSPKLLIMALRDHTLAKAPYLLADENKRESLLAGSETLTREVERPLVGDTGDEWFYMPDNGAAVVDSDVLWSCVTCGACVQQCPVDIEHVDHVIDMRRYQVLVESSFPAELNQLFKGMENKGNPWNMSSTARMDWAKDLPFDVKVVGDDIESLDEVDWLFWVGCAGAYEDRAKKTTRAVAELLHLAGVSFGVLGNGETCTGDSARRAGNEFVFQGLAMQNIETFKEHKVKKVVSTCAHCFNTLKNEYREFGIELEVVHHTQLLNRLVRDKRLTPVAAQGAASRSVTYHDPCYLGRHNQVYSPPRELLEVIPDADFVEMPRNSERSFCCGAGGARMWMEETIGERINTNRTKEAVATGADQIAVGCPFCRVMLSDGLTNEQSAGNAREEVEVLDVAQLLLASVKGEAPKKAAPSAGRATPSDGRATPSDGRATPSDGRATPSDGRATPSDGRAASAASDVETPAATVTATEQVGPAARASGGGGSLFDVGTDEPSDTAETTDAKVQSAEQGTGSLFAVEDDSNTSQPVETSPVGGGGSLFDLGDDEESTNVSREKAAGIAATAHMTGSQDDTDTDAPNATAHDPGSGASSTPSATIPEGGSLFDIEAPDEEGPGPGGRAPSAPTDEKGDEQGDVKAGEDAAGDSTTDLDVDRSADDADRDVTADGEVAADGDGGAGPARTASGSMFDIAAPGRQISATDGAREPGPEPAAEQADVPPQAAQQSTVSSLKDLKARFADPAEENQAESAGSPSPANSAKPEPPGEAAEPTPAQPSAATDGTSSDQAVTEAGQGDSIGDVSKGDRHAPRTDTEIDEAGSLFDL